MTKQKKLSKKKDKGNGMSISDDLTEILKRVKDKEPELSEVADRLSKQNKTTNDSTQE